MFPRYHNICIYRSQLWSLKSIFVAVSSRRVHVFFYFLSPFSFYSSFFCFFLLLFDHLLLLSIHRSYYLPLLISQDRDYPSSDAVVGEMSAVRRVPLPPELVDQFSTMQCNCAMGLFTNVSRAWLTIDSDIFVWNYEDGSDVAFYDQVCA